MTYNTQTRTTGVDRAIAGLLVAGVTFVLGYTVVRASMAQSAQPIITDNDVEVIVPGEGTLWADFGKSF